MTGSTCSHAVTAQGLVFPVCVQVLFSLHFVGSDNFCALDAFHAS